MDPFGYPFKFLRWQTAKSARIDLSTGTSFNPNSVSRFQWRLLYNDCLTKKLLNYNQLAQKYALSVKKCLF